MSEPGMNMLLTVTPALHFVVGEVEQVIPETASIGASA